MNNNSTFTLEVRVDLKDLANVARFLLMQGTLVTAKGSIVRIAVQTLSELLVQQGKVQPVQTYAEAMEVMDALGIATLHNKGKHQKALLNALLEEQENPESPFSVQDVLREMESLPSKDSTQPNGRN